MKWKLNQLGELYDMTDAPFVEKLVPPDQQDAEAKAARQRLQAVLDQLNPAGGKTEPPAPPEKQRPRAQRRAARAAQQQ